MAGKYSATEPIRFPRIIATFAGNGGDYFCSSLYRDLIYLLVIKVKAGDPFPPIDPYV